jgi:Mn2+/Fe2+ NRAMP family transporter
MDSPLKSPDRRALSGAVFLMATSAIGPGFLTQTAVFTQQLGAAFGFAILVSIALDIGAQLNVWHVLIEKGKRAQEVAQDVIRGAGVALAAMVVFGGFAFNIGNLSGAGLGLQSATGMSVTWGAVLSAALAVGIFLKPGFRGVLDRLIPILGIAMIAMTAYVMITSPPPMGDVARNLIWPDRFDAFAILTIVGGTVGGYISFAGAHRLLDAGFKGREHKKDVGRSAVQAIGVAAVMRFVLFLAVLGVISAGGVLDAANPAASAFKQGAGSWGQLLFGFVMWAAAMTSVIGSAYTSISFVKTWHPSIEQKEGWWISGFIGVSLTVLLVVGRPVELLVWAGTLNGFILPFGLGLLLWAGRGIVGQWAGALGWITVAATLALGAKALV